MPKTTTSGKSRSELKAWRDPETLDYLYNDRGLTQYEMAALLGCSQDTVRRWMKRVDRKFETNWKAERPPWFGTKTDGYEVWDHTSHGDKFEVLVHRLMAVAECGFDAVIDNHVHHRNGIPWDNRPENLEVLTPGDHVREHASRGERARKLTPEEVREIRRLRSKGKTISELGEIFDVNPNNIWLIDEGEIWEWLE